MTFNPTPVVVGPAMVGGGEMTRIVLLIGAVIVVAMVSPRMRVRTLIPVACVLLGLALAPDGVVPTLENAVRAVGAFLRTLPIGVLKG